MIVVSGASGQLGRLIVREFTKANPNVPVVASMRDTAKSTGLFDNSVQIRYGDFADPTSLKAAFFGAEQVLMISADKLGEEALALHRTAIAAAREAGVTRLLYTSHMGAKPDSPFPPASQHWGTEQDLAASGLAFTALRHGFYAESCLHMIGDGLRSGELRTPEDGPVSWTARADLAAADAAILAASSDWEGITPPLTASAAVTMADIAEIASERLGRAIRQVTVTDEEWVKGKIASGTPPIYAEMLLGTFQAARRGDFAATGPALTNLIGREPISVGEVISAHFT